LKIINTLIACLSDESCLFKASVVELASFCQFLSRLFLKINIRMLQNTVRFSNRRIIKNGYADTELNQLSQICRNINHLKNSVLGKLKGLITLQNN
jgi:hypothetical protein